MNLFLMFLFNRKSMLLSCNEDFFEFNSSDTNGKKSEIRVQNDVFVGNKEYQV